MAGKKPRSIATAGGRRGMLRAVLALLSASLSQSSAIAAIAPTDSVLQPNGKWIVDYADQSCGLTRDVTDGAVKAHFGVRSNPIGDGGDVVLIVDRPSTAEARLAEGKIVIGQSKSFRTDAEIFSPADHQRIVYIWGSSTILADLVGEDSTTLALSPGPGKPFMVGITGAKAAIAALRACQDDLLQSWGVDPNFGKKAAIPPAPANDSSRWMTSADYPRKALAQRLIGTARIFYRINTDGTADNCRVVKSSGTPELDNAACTALMARARFKPATAADGTPVFSYGIRSIKYKF